MPSKTPPRLNKEKIEDVQSDKTPKVMYVCLAVIVIIGITLVLL
jgi:hypothetical protein